MIDTTAPTAQKKQRVTCPEFGKLIATIDSDGLWIWCLYHKRPELIRREVCIAAWEKGESVQCEVAQASDGV